MRANSAAGSLSSGDSAAAPAIVISASRPGNGGARSRSGEVMLKGAGPRPEPQAAIRGAADHAIAARGQLERRQCVGRCAQGRIGEQREAGGAVAGHQQHRGIRIDGRRANRSAQAAMRADAFTVHPGGGSAA
jgi:hypothetical protein